MHSFTNNMPLKITGTGKLGEDIAVKFLLGKGYVVIDRNYLRKWGEIDIVANKDKKLYFFEVKAVSHETQNGVIRETSSYRPEDNVHRNKLKRLSRVIQTYLFDKNVSQETNWEFGIVTVTIFEDSKKARVKLIKDIIIGSDDL